MKASFMKEGILVQNFLDGDIRGGRWAVQAERTKQHWAVEQQFWGLMVIWNCESEESGERRWGLEGGPYVEAQILSRKECGH